MTKQEYITIRELAWNILLNSNASKLPIDITPIAKLYNLQDVLNYSNTRYNNATIVTKKILVIYGLPDTKEFVNALCIRLLAPLCILKECNIITPQEISKYCDIPLNVAEQRTARLQVVIKRNKFFISNLEKKVFDNFSEFITMYNQN